MPRPVGEFLIGEVFKQCVTIAFVQYLPMATILRFWERTIPISTPTFQQRFINIHALNMDGQVRCIDRCNKVVRDSELYFAVRLHASAVLPSFVMAEIEIKVQNEVYYDPLLERMRYWDAMLICIYNVRHYVPALIQLR
jgi:hypothetical protein